MKFYLTFPKETPESAVKETADRIATWHIVRNVMIEGSTIKWEQAIGCGSGEASLSTFKEGIMLGYSIGQPKKLISFGIEKEQVK